ncbi:hypothetical protein BpHYR1_033283 [Brachionus plicatilis]|uniref:Uncharacterized protein n=1 Tax=Brachionus plicatilis TaxID=10195 RepID=A0A3M7R7C8_BRAPC|nr:hypothetical protein BpHYR1_033283 [Brachionus plicatilis]
MEGVNVCACTSHMTLGINARVPQHGITGQHTEEIKNSKPVISIKLYYSGLSIKNNFWVTDLTSGFLLLFSTKFYMKLKKQNLVLSKFDIYDAFQQALNDYSRQSFSIFTTITISKIKETVHFRAIEDITTKRTAASLAITIQKSKSTKIKHKIKQIFFF